MASSIANVAPDFWRRRPKAKLIFMSGSALWDVLQKKVRMDLCGTQTREHDHAVEE